MGRKNNQGQILIEVSVVMAFLFLVAFTALNELQTIKEPQQKFKFTKDTKNVQKGFSTNKK